MLEHFHCNVVLYGGYPGYEGMVCVCTCVSMIGGYPGYEEMLHAEGSHDYGQGRNSGAKGM